MIKIDIKYIILSIISIILLHGCSSLDKMQQKAKTGVLMLSFADANWDGKTIPKGQQCKEFGGNGASPRIKVENIPIQANKLILEFSDETYSPCDLGGHGIISYTISRGTTEIIVPSVTGQTFDLPEGFTLIKEHCGADLAMKRGAYIGPCPGYGNHYYVVVKAVYQVSEKAEFKLLGKGRLELGTYK